MNKKILITGGAGYIGSHTASELLDEGFSVIIADDLSAGSLESVDSRAVFYKVDVTDEKAFFDVLSQEKVDAVLHCAGQIVVSESIDNPAKYYMENVAGMTKVLNTLAKAEVKKIMFSSTASVYGNNCFNEKATELTTVAPVNPYAETKYVGERLLYWMAKRYDWQYVVFRYFNVAGAMIDGSNGLRVEKPTHIIPNANKAALGEINQLNIFGNDYPTKDGTCVRDYIHVLDLARAHVLGMKYLFEQEESNLFNLGSDQGYSVKEIVDKVIELSGVQFNYQYSERRAGDPASVLADSTKAKDILKWRPEYSLEEIILSDLNWRKNNFGRKI
ncbi:UDP-glucose 4-epimerase GalE [Enterococcus faecalis]|uniref:UDP-glucose 4-epimerase GalE n=1 Tax=Enterococcus faecalis TaxID=1351 RepID=UPI00325B8182